MQDARLLPGFIDAHVHIADQAELAARQALQLGVTTQLDMFSSGDRLKKIKQLETEGRPDFSDLKHMAMVEKSVEHGGDRGRVAQQFSPILDGSIRGQQRARALVAVVDLF